MTASTIDEAFEAAYAGVDLIIIGTYFDNGRMFDLLRKLKSSDQTRNSPVLCVRAITAPEAFDRSSRPLFSNLDVVATACRALGAVDFIDYCSRQDAGGVERASLELRSAVRVRLS